MTAPRRIVPGTTYMVTRRCTQRQFLLLPDKAVKQIIRYCAAMAQKATGVRICVICVLSNHYHLVVIDVHGLLPEFTYIFDKFVAKCVNAYRGRWENLFAAGVQASYVELADTAAILDKAAYSIVNPVKAGLVKTHGEWPGVLLYGKGKYKCPRPPIFFREGGPTERTLTLEISDLPLPGKSQAIRYLLRKEVVEREVAIRRKFRKAGRKFLGTRRVMAQDPFASPGNAEPRRTLSARVASRDKWRRIECLQRNQEFNDGHRQARAAFANGDRNAVFPAGTYQMRIRYQVRCAEV